MGLAYRSHARVTVFPAHDFLSSVIRLADYIPTRLSLLPGTDLVLTVASRSVTPERYHEALCRFEPPLPLSGFNYEQAWHIRKNTDPAHQWLRRAIGMSCDKFRLTDEN